MIAGLATLGGGALIVLDRAPPPSRASDVRGGPEGAGGRAVTAHAGPASTPLAAPVLPAEADDQAPASDSVAAITPAPRDAVTFAASFAAEVCACVDAACAEQVNDHYRAQLGAVRPELDARKLHDAFARAAECQRALAPPS